MPNFETSFIPEQGTTYQGGAKRSTIATVFSILIILGSVGVSGWVWWQEKQEVAKVKNLETELGNMESRFDIAKISELGLLDKKIVVAKGMLDKHPMPSMLIDYVAENTVSSIKWKQLAYTRFGGAQTAGDSKDSGDAIDLTGETIGYSPLYQQLEHFRTRCKEVTSVELKSFSIDPRTNILSLQIRLIVNPNYATVATLRAKSAANNVLKEKPTEAQAEEIPVVNNIETQPQVELVPTTTVKTPVSAVTKSPAKNNPARVSGSTSTLPVVTNQIQ